MPLYAGVCETNITPPIGVWMCGYALRPTGCTAIHDELYARAIVFDDGRKPLAIVTMDLLGLDVEMVRRVRAAISERTGIAPEAIMLNAAHNHAGPMTERLLGMGEPDPAYVEVLERKLVGVTVQAAASLQPALLAYGRAPVQVGINRRQTRGTGGRTILGNNFAGPVMPWVDTLTVLDSRREPFAVLYSHACHLTTLGGENLQISAELAGYAAREIRAQTDGKVMPLFLQGCAGNINPLRRGTFEAVEHNGRTLGAATVEAMRDAKPRGTGEEALDYAERTFLLPLTPPSPLEECEREVADWERNVAEMPAGSSAGQRLYAEGMLESARGRLKVRQTNPMPLEKPFAIQALRVGEAQLVGLPGEVFVQYALDAQRMATGPVFVLAYTNGCHGYVPTSADFPQGGYEVETAHRFYDTLAFAPECENALRCAIEGMLAA